MSCHPRLATNSLLLPNPDHAPCSSPSSAGTDVQAAACDASIVESNALVASSDDNPISHGQVFLVGTPR